MQQTWVTEQTRSPHHIIALLGIVSIVFCAEFLQSEIAVYVGYVLFFLVTAAPMLKTMILFSILIGGLVTVMPFLAPIALVLMIVFFLMRINYVIQNWRPVLVGLLVYGFAVFLVSVNIRSILGILFFPQIAPFLYSISGSTAMLLLPTLDALLCGIILHLLLIWLYRNGYTSTTALGIMGGVPLVIIAMVLPFLKVFAETGPAVDFAHTSHGDAHMQGYAAKGAPGYTHINSYVRSVPDGIAENNLSANHGGDGHQIPEAKLQIVKAHWRSNPDGIAENNLSYHGQHTMKDTTTISGQPEHIKAPYIMDSSKHENRPVPDKTKQLFHNKKFLVAMAAILLIGTGSYFYYYNMDSESITTKTPTMPVQQTPNTQKTSSVSEKKSTIKTLQENDLVLADFKLGSNISDVRRKLGAALKGEKGRSTFRYTAPSLGLEFDTTDTQGIITGIVADKSNVRTARGISVGDSVAKITAVYGDAAVTSYKNYDLYEYFYKGSANYILRFAVDKNSNQVDYISVRLEK